MIRFSETTSIFPNAIRRIVLGGAALGLVASASILAGAPVAAAEEAPSPKIEVVEAAATPKGDEVAAIAAERIGAPYQWGGAGPFAFDCTGFVQWVYSQVGIFLPRTEAGQLNGGEPVASSSELRPGDVVVFANTYRAGLSHTGIYVGDGQFVHAVDEGRGVAVSNLGNAYWAYRYVGASRPAA